MSGFIATIVIALLVIVFAILFILSRWFVRCPSNKVLCVQGRVGGGKTVACYHGGFKIILPVVQEARFLDLTPLTLNIPLRGALSAQNIRVNVPSTFTIGIDTNPDIMTNAAVRLLDFTTGQIETTATEIILGQLRLTIASLTIEQINRDREGFLESIRKNIGPELAKIGLLLINVNITDITDESGYIESIGKKAASEALNKAKIDVAVQEKLGEIGKAEADKEKRVQVASYYAQAVEGENQAKARIAAYNAELAQKTAEASQIGQVAEQQATAEIQKARALAEVKRLEAEVVVPREIEKRKVEIDAEAAAQKQRFEAKGEADAILSIKSAEAEGIRKVLDAKANGYSGLVEACGSNSKDAATMLLVEKLETIVTLQTEAIRNIKIDKVTVWDSGSSNGKGTATSNFMSNMVQALPPLHEVAKMAGVDLPEYLGRIDENGTPKKSTSGQPPSK